MPVKQITRATKHMESVNFLNDQNARFYIGPSVSHPNSTSMRDICSNLLSKTSQQEVLQGSN